jgi:hypothetical protein
VIGKDWIAFKDNCSSKYTSIVFERLILPRRDLITISHPEAALR